MHGRCSINRQLLGRRKPAGSGLNDALNLAELLTANRGV
jgi:hypothetical protein